MGERGRLIVIGLVILQLLLAAIGAWHWARHATEGADELENLPAVPAEIPRPVTLESAYPFAVKRAMSWDRDARLVLVSAQIDWPLEVPPGPLQEVAGGGWLTYVFVRERGDGEAESLGLLIERYSGRIVQERTVGWDEPAPEGGLRLSELPVGSVEAILTAEGSQGTDFRRSCPEARHQTRLSLGVSGATVDRTVLTHGDMATPVAIPTSNQSTESAAGESGLTWLLGYRDVRDEGRSPLAISVDAMTGAVAIEDRNVPATEGCPG